MFCYVDDYIDSYYTNIPDDYLEELFYKRAKTGVFDKEELLYLAYSLFEDTYEFWQLLFGSEEKFETDFDIIRYVLNGIYEQFVTEDNKEKIENNRSELFNIIEAAEKAGKEE